MISIKTCLEKMHAGEKFSLKAVQWDERRVEKRGKILEVACAQLVWGDGGNDRVARMERPMTEQERTLAGITLPIKKDPHHAANYTRNIRLVVDGLGTEVIYKIRPLLIIEFNGQKTTA